MTLRCLALDGSGPLGGVALLEGDRLVETTSCPEGPGFGVTLYARVEHLLTQHHVTVADLGLLTVTLGPGSFTGLRFALGLAKGMALVHGIPILGISTLALQAEASQGHHPWILPLRDAGQGLLFFALYNALADGTREVIPPSMGRLAEMSARLQATIPGETPLCCGPGVAMHAEGLEKMRCHVPDHPHAQPSAALLGLMGLNRWRHGAQPAACNLEPLYLRPPQAEMKRLESGT
ncbi:MAG: tRNA (adenosine(37)-N6)-threonylcarbamoyltransferase complex dimerization subunit type 1 TsaB [Magnetococcales bacterium]|nr:tRNA (adenosine(37)-N6)-threonylcarbamoyltransferase complex dimerization subunit type 1 TsaB [Magnetococcales bacterium]